METHKHNASTLQNILCHEHEHSCQCHSIDILCGQLSKVCFWYNPLVYIYIREQQLNLEHLADKAVVERMGNAKTYQYQLLDFYTNTTAVSILNNFNQSQLKKRIIMMNMKPTNEKRFRKYIHIIPIFSALIIVFGVNASLIKKRSNTGNSTLAQTEISVRENDKVVVPDVMPSFEGSLQEYIGNNVKYPKEAAEQKISGKVLVRFIIERNGSISNVEVLEAVNPLLDAEAIRVISDMPTWIPGTINGKPVRVSYVLPINFTL